MRPPTMKHIRIHILLPPELKRRIDALLWDDFNERPQYGAIQRVVRDLLHRWATEEERRRANTTRSPSE